MIDEKKLIKEMERWATTNFSVLDDKYEYRLEGMIAAQDIVLAQPQIQLEYETGEWMGSVCSCCGESVSEWYNFKFCPMCGAKMEGYKE